MDHRQSALDSVEYELALGSWPFLANWIFLSAQWSLPSSIDCEIPQKYKRKDIKSIIKKDDYGENKCAEYFERNSTNQFDWIWVKLIWVHVWK